MSLLTSKWISISKIFDILLVKSTPTAHGHKKDLFKNTKFPARVTLEAPQERSNQPFFLRIVKLLEERTHAETHVANLSPVSRVVIDLLRHLSLLHLLVLH